MKISSKIVYIITLSTGLSLSAVAADCGAPPLDQPQLPAASTLTTKTLKSARESTVEFSNDIDDYMSCMDQRGRKLLPYMTKEQQTRWEEDLTELHENRRQLQISLNDLIRNYRKQSSAQ